MTRPDEMLAFHDGLFGGHAFLGLEGGRIHFSNGTHYSVNADGGVTWSEPYPGLDNRTALLAYSNFNYPDAQGRKRKSSPVRTITVS